MTSSFKDHVQELLEEHRGERIVRFEYLGKQYVTELEAIVKKYPHQWFNYYDFWNEL